MKAISKLIKSNPPAKPSLVFPILMKHTHSDTVVLFTDYNTGVIVHPDPASKNETLGKVSKGWTDHDNELVWTPYPGTVQLSNK